MGEAIAVSNIETVEDKEIKTDITDKDHSDEETSEGDDTNHDIIPKVDTGQFTDKDRSDKETIVSRHY